MRGVTIFGKCINSCFVFQLTRLMRGVTAERSTLVGLGLISTHTPHARRDLRNIDTYKISYYFNSHASCEA